MILYDIKSFDQQVSECCIYSCDALTVVLFYKERCCFSAEVLAVIQPSPTMLSPN